MLVPSGERGHAHVARLRLSYSLALLTNVGLAVICSLTLNREANSTTSARVRTNGAPTKS
jgi:hypothetical protein